MTVFLVVSKFIYWITNINCIYRQDGLVSKCIWVFIRNSHSSK